MPTTNEMQRIECARVRIGAALLEANHLAQTYREAMHKLEQAYMDMCNVMGSALATSPDGVQDLTESL